MGQNTLGSLIKDAAVKTGLGKRVTNHSMRKTCVTTLFRAGVPPQKIMKITGHKNIQSITHYDAELSETEHRNIFEILQNPTKPKPLQPININTNAPVMEPIVPQSASHQANDIPSSAMPLALANKTPFPSGCVFNNCTFNF